MAEPIRDVIQVSLNDLTARILRVPHSIRALLPRETSTILLKLPGRLPELVPYRGDRGFLSSAGVSETMRVLVKGDTVQRGDAIWTYLPDARLLELERISPDGPVVEHGPHRFVVGRTYTRQTIRRALGLPPDEYKGAWSTGYVEHGGAWYIFANIDSPGRSGPGYTNRWRGADLSWQGKTKSRSDHPSIRSLTDPETHVYIFTRNDNRDDFTYQGRGRAIDVENVIPVRVVWRFESAEPTFDPAELERRADSLGCRPLTTPAGCLRPATRVVAGAMQIERDPAVRAFVLQQADGVCEACQQPAPFLTRGGRPYLELHHVQRLADGGPDTPWNAVGACPNCHRRLHHGGDAGIFVERLYGQVARLRRPGVLPTA